LELANTRLKQHAAEAAELSAARERNRVAREIHDGLGHYLTAIHVQLEAARALWSSDDQRSLDQVRKAQQLAREGLNDVRRSVALLRTPSLPVPPLLDQLQALVAQNAGHLPPIELLVAGTQRPLPSSVEHALLRVAQEGITNARRHADPSRIELLLTFLDTDVHLLVADDGEPKMSGNAMSTGSGVSGFGLVGLRERVEILGGRVWYGPRPERGFELNVVVVA
jgi:signal transduction histidine kinase